MIPFDFRQDSLQGSLLACTWEEPIPREYGLTCKYKLLTRVTLGRTVICVEGEEDTDKCALHGLGAVGVGVGVAIAGRAHYDHSPLTRLVSEKAR